jgi:hypothetical protein
MRLVLLAALVRFSVVPLDGFDRLQTPTTHHPHIQAPAEQLVEEALTLEDFKDHHTAWILLGLVKDGGWAMHPSFKVWLDNSFRRPDQPPTRGDRIKVTSPTRLVIIDFKKTGEELWYKSPATQAKITAHDSTGFVLPPNSEVRVNLISISDRGPGNMAAVWAQVVPLGTTVR